HPTPSTLITGVKRDISLLQQVAAVADDRVLVLDISLDKNRAPLLALLAQEIEVSYFDHHYAGEIPVHPHFIPYINTDSNTCTSLLVNAHLSGAHALWAIVGAYGDNFDERADTLAQKIGVDSDVRSQLRDLGIFINYNAYGETVEDLHIPPSQLFSKLNPYRDPLEFIAHDTAFVTLQTGYHEDMARAAAIKAEIEAPGHALYIFPATSWARRVCGVYANALAQQYPQRAHALLTELHEGGYLDLVSVRAPLANKTGADELCRQFATGGGRKAAAGINQLPTVELERFIQAFSAAYPG
ncbi:MAG: hypothetical protein FD130_2453, partial [Halothiobacillaceae bacterium]